MYLNSLYFIFHGNFIVSFMLFVEDCQCSYLTHHYVFSIYGHGVISCKGFIINLAVQLNYYEKLIYSAQYSTFGICRKTQYVFACTEDPSEHLKFAREKCDKSIFSFGFLFQLSMLEVLRPAIDLAETGFPVQQVAASFWNKGDNYLSDLCTLRF